jgi:hypothetical protein
LLSKKKVCHRFFYEQPRALRLRVNLKEDETIASSAAGFTTCCLVLQTKDNAKPAAYQPIPKFWSVRICAYPCTMYSSYLRTSLLVTRYLGENLLWRFGEASLSGLPTARLKALFFGRSFEEWLLKLFKPKVSGLDSHDPSRDYSKCCVGEAGVKPKSRPGHKWIM